MFRLEASEITEKTLEELKRTDEKRAKKIRRALKKLAVDPSHNSLQTHKFHSETGPQGEQLFVAYAENNTPSAWRILFFYPKVEKGKKPEKVIGIYSVIPHL